MFTCNDKFNNAIAQHLFGHSNRNYISLKIIPKLALDSRRIVFLMWNFRFEFERSVAGNEGKCEFTVDSTKTTPEGLDASDVVLIEGQSGGSIVGITPAALSSSIVGISPGKPEHFFSHCQSFLMDFNILGAALEKKSVRDMAAGLNRLGGKLLTITSTFFLIFNCIIQKHNN